MTEIESSANYWIHELLVVWLQVFVLCLVHPMLPVSLDCPFLLPFRYSLTCICPVSCAPYVASFSDKYMLENTEMVVKRTIQRNWQHRVHETQDK
jgi:hypothetical protein